MDPTKDMVDPYTGILLTPSFHGEQCLGDGEHEGYECCCDECNYYLICFPGLANIFRGSLKKLAVPPCVFDFIDV